MYSPNSLNSFAPRNFKNTIGKYGPSFSGWQQQDSQEFLLFLLDGLQEDLNRIKKKPYIEKPDSTDEMVNDPKALMAMADKCWEIYKARNDSVITDLFAGMYKSTVVCPVCDKVSIIFDPFNNLTLQLPIESLWSRKICYFSLNGKPINVPVDIDKNASFAALKEYMAAKVGTDAKRTVLAEVYKHKFYKVFDDKTCISDEHIAEADDICLFELEEKPTNFPLVKKVTKAKSFLHSSSDEDQIPDGDTPLDEKMLVTVYHRRFKGGSSRYQQKELCAVPSFIVLNREEARDYDAILRKLLARVATLTTKDFLREGDASESEESDTVLMNMDEADSSTDSRVQAKSLESEDGMVDVSMHDSEETTLRPKHLDPKLLPSMLRPGSLISPGAKLLFEPKVLLSIGTEMIPTGLSPLTDENKSYPTLASRQPQPPAEVKMDTNELIRRRQEAGSPATSDEDADDVLPSAQIQAQAQDSGDESDGLPPVTQILRPKTKGLGMSTQSRYRNGQGLITYSRKGKQANFRARREEASPPAENAPLLRLGESIILDWSNEGYDSLFGGTKDPDGEMRGAPTFDDPPTLPDPELDEKRKIRNSRKKNGVTLGDCLDEFGKAEILSENDAWYCPRCKEHRRASKQFQLWKAPDILVIHLKRFSAQGRFRDKLDVLVDFPIEGLDLSTRLAVPDPGGKSPIYDLIAVDNHYGGLGGGHYTAYAQNFLDTEKTWYEYNGNESNAILKFEMANTNQIPLPCAEQIQKSS
jgi:ubiquitin carboxyl-terminal hydrolase 4/11/15